MIIFKKYYEEGNNMKCFYHNDKDAHAICKNCSKAICSDCSINIEGEIYCPECFSSVIEYQKKYLLKLKIRYIIGGVLAAFFFFGLLKDNPGEAMILGIGLGNFPIGLFAMKNSPNPYVPLSYEGLGKIILLKWLIAFVFGPIFTIISIFTYIKTSKTIKANEALLEKVISR